MANKQSPGKLRIYLANLSHAGPRIKDWVFDLVGQERIFALESFWQRGAVDEALRRRSKFKIFLDSGAYSWHSATLKSGGDLDRQAERKYLNAYIAFIHRYKDRFHVYANLDVIGDPVRTLENQKYMESNGLNPLPVFHYSVEQIQRQVRKQHFKFLTELVENYDYIGLGGGASEGLSGNTTQFGDDVFRIIKDVSPGVKVHGFGVTSIPSLLRYPFFSVDSTTWLIIAINGSVIVPRGGKVYTEKPVMIKISQLWQDWARYSKQYVQRTLDYFDSIGVDVEKMTSPDMGYEERQRANILYFMTLAEELCRADGKDR